MFLKKTVDGVMASFTKAIADMTEVMHGHDSEAAHHQRVADEAITQRLHHMNEAARASRFIDKMNEMVS